MITGPQRKIRLLARDFEPERRFRRLVLREALPHIEAVQHGLALDKRRREGLDIRRLVARLPREIDPIKRRDRNADRRRTCCPSFSNSPLRGAERRLIARARPSGMPRRQGTKKAREGGLFDRRRPADTGRNSSQPRWSLSRQRVGVRPGGRATSTIPGM